MCVQVVCSTAPLQAVTSPNPPGMSLSGKHSHNVPLILNLKTRDVTGQHHVIINAKIRTD